MRGGNLTRAQFVEKISDCIPQDLPDIPISVSGYQNNNDDWTKLAENISYNGPIEFQCDGKDAQIYGINLDINFDTGTKKGELYGKIGNSTPVRLWWNGRQQTYEPPPGFTRITSQNDALSTPPRTTTLQNSPPQVNRRNTNQGVYQPDTEGVTRSLFNEEDTIDDDNRVSPSSSYRRSQ
jgi:hypothetical protein